MNSWGANKAVHSHFSSRPFLAKEPVVALVSLLPLWPNGSRTSIISWLARKSSEAGNSSVAGHSLVSFANAPGQTWSTALAGLAEENIKKGRKVLRCQSVLYLTTDIGAADRPLWPSTINSTE